MRRVGRSNPWFIGALLVSMGLTAFGVTLSGLPTAAMNAAQLLIGVSLGVRFTRSFIRSAPLWLVGTSRGTVSAAAAAIAMPEQPLAGLVLTSSVVSYHSIGSLWSQDLASIRLPVLVMHQARDACRVCRPADVPALLAKFSQAPVKKLLMLDGGANPSGDPCEPMHWHGFVGMDQQAVDAIADWMQHPVP